MLTLKDVHFSYGTHPVIQEVSLTLNRGASVALVGPNGAGKSTLIKIMLYLLKVSKGEIKLKDRPLSAWSRKELANTMAYVPQSHEVPFAFSVKEVISMGRYAHVGRFEPFGPVDHEAIEQAIADTQLNAFLDRSITQLSGGERQKVLLARALAQSPSFLMLDEPTANLDLQHSHSILGLLQTLVKRGKGVIMALHDLNLAARYADRVLLMKEGRVVCDGPPEEVLVPKHLDEVFGVKTRLIKDPSLKHHLIDVMGIG